MVVAKRVSWREESGEWSADGEEIKRGGKGEGGIERVDSFQSDETNTERRGVSYLPSHRRKKPLSVSYLKSDSNDTASRLLCCAVLKQQEVENKLERAGRKGLLDAHLNGQTTQTGQTDASYYPPI